MAYLTNYESLYSGSFSSMDPEFGAYSTTGVNRVYASNLGFTTNPTVSNQLGEAVKVIKSGTKNVEIGGLDQKSWEGIPLEHFDEIKALSKLTGVKPSVHAPIVDPAGFGQQGQQTEIERATAERKFFDVLEKAKMLDDNGNVPVVFHSSAATPGSIYFKDKDKEEKYLGMAVDQESGKLMPIRREEKYTLQTTSKEFDKKGTVWTPEKSIDSHNAAEWENKLTTLAEMRKRAGEVIDKAISNYNVIQAEKIKISDEDSAKNYSKLMNQAEGANQLIQSAGLFVEDARLGLTGLFDRAYKYGTDEQRTELRKVAEAYQKNIEKHKEEIEENGTNPMREVLWKTKSVDDALFSISSIVKEAPEVTVSAEKYIAEKSGETFGNVAFQSFKKFGDKAPMIVIENMDPERGTFARAEDLKMLIDNSRDTFAKNLMKKEGYSEERAKKIASEKIGATWDVGHLNMMKKFGYTDEDLIKETEKIAKYVKHIHLTDNFGFDDSHLVPGMGNVPFKEHLEKLEKAGVLKKVRQITEAGGFVNTFGGASPVSATMAAMGSPIYGMNAGPYWNQVANAGSGYFAGYGTLNPALHHSMYGSGFTTLPIEVGGQIPGTQSRFSGTPMS